MKYLNDCMSILTIFTGLRCYQVLLVSFWMVRWYAAVQFRTAAKHQIQGFICETHLQSFFVFRWLLKVCFVWEISGKDKTVASVRQTTAWPRWEKKKKFDSPRSQQYCRIKEIRFVVLRKQVGKKSQSLYAPESNSSIWIM